MAILLMADGRIITFQPKDGKSFQLAEMQNLIGGMIEVCHLPHSRILVIDGEGKIKNKPLNVKATELYDRNDCIVGDAILCKSEEVE